MFNYQFFTYSFITGILVSILATVFSFFIVTKKSSFFPVGIAHSAFGGIAIGIFLSISPFFTGIIFSLLMAAFLTYLQTKNRNDMNTLIGILFPFSMALGIFLVSVNKKVSIDLFSYLFGNILSITKQDLFIYIILFLFVSVFFILFFNRLLYIDFDSIDAKINGINVMLFEYSFYLLLALTIMISIKLLGIILVSALFILPGALALNFHVNYKKGIILSMIITLLIFVISLFISFYIEVPVSPLIILFYTFVYFVFFIINGKKKRIS